MQCLAGLPTGGRSGGDLLQEQFLFSLAPFWGHLEQQPPAFITARGNWNQCGMQEQIEDVFPQVVGIEISAGAAAREAREILCNCVFLRQSGESGAVFMTTASCSASPFALE